MATRASHRIGLSIALCALFCCLGVSVFKPGRTVGAGDSRHPEVANQADIRSAILRGRRLSEQQVKILRAQLKVFGSQKFWVITETGEYAPQSEQARFGQQLRQILVLAGWIETQKVRQRMGSAGFRETSMYAYNRGGDSGLLIFAAPDSIAAGRALNTALRGLLFRTSIERDDSLRNAILVFVGAQ
jgi:hypothetical protein